MPGIFIYETLSGGGALADEAQALALLPQGRAMRDAVLADLAALPGLQISCAVGRRPGSGLPMGLQAAAGSALRAVAPEPGEPDVVFVARQARQHDGCWVIAPESGGLLSALQAAVGPPRWLGCDAASLRVASSKSATLAALAARGVCTPLALADHSRRWVVKPDDGAGGHDTRVFPDLARAAAHAEACGLAGQAMALEPFVEGEALSVSMLVGPGWVQALSFNRQRVDVAADGQLGYLGVDILAIDPVRDPRGVRLHLLALEAVRALPGLNGFVGIDLVWHAERGPVVIEVNPRVTSAYVGLSAALGRNLAGELLRSHGLLAEPAARPPRPEPALLTIGWDIGGAHAKACRVQGGRLVDVAQWACPLWQGLPQLDAVLAQAALRWPDAGICPQGGAPGLAAVQHVATMTAEMVDLFPDREAGVGRLAAHLAAALGPGLRLYAGAGLGEAGLGGEGRWVSAQAPQVQQHWAAIASANWRATAEWLGRRLGDAVLVDIGSTTSDLIALRRGRLVAPGQSDAQRLASGELVYQGVVRTPLCALTQQLQVEGQASGVMNEWFATTADVYRLLGQLAPEHDQQATADGADKGLPATRQRLARMVGRDARELPDAQWLALAAQWREAQLQALATALRRVLAAAELPPGAPLVAAGCGGFLVAALAQALQRPVIDFAQTLPLGPEPLAGDWASVAAPAVAVALLAVTEAGAAPCG